MPTRLFALLLASLAAAPSATFPGLKLEPGFKAEVFASSNHVGNAVAICFDRAGDLYTVEANRRLTGTWGVTMSRWWAMEDYGNTTLADRAAMYGRWAHIVPPAKLTRHADVLRRIFDRDRDGMADTSETLASFDDPLAGNAAGVLAWDDQLFVANAPSLWSLPLNNPARRQPLHTGLGVRVGVYGHDLHGLIAGPDGRLYFSLGDRGFHLRTKEGKLLSAPRRGAVFRCFPDGSGLELFHVGLRNPQDLAFNELGDLFTVDNDMGGIDRSRVVHVIEGGDSGWDATCQLTRNFREETGRDDHTEPPWFTERLWETRHAGQPAWLHPPIAHLTSGPSGMAFDPGWGLPAGLGNAMFVCDFKGSSARSGIHSFHLQAVGAGWRMTRTNQFAWGILPTDIEFGHDGCLYVADWIGGWGGDGERRIVRLAFGQSRTSVKATEVRTLFAGDWPARTAAQLTALLGHFDRRVRLQAQYELARRGDPAPFRRTAVDATFPLSRRLHGVHGLWQTGLRRLPESDDFAVIGRLLKDNDPEIRGQAAKALGEIGNRSHAKWLEPLLADGNARVRYFAAVGLAHLNDPQAAPSLVALLRQEADPVVRHGAVLALSRLVSPAGLADFGADFAPRIRLATVLALRRLESSALFRFLDDRDPAVRLAAIRAVHDLPIPGAMEALIAHGTPGLLADETVPFPVRHRLLNARFRRGRTEDARWLAAAAADPSLPEAVRLESLSCLEHWEQPSAFDRVTWHHRPVSGPRATGLGPVIAPAILGLIDRARTSTDERSLLKPAARLIARCQLGTAAQRLALLTDANLDAAARIPVFIGLAETATPGFTKASQTLLREKNPGLRILAAEQLLPRAEAITALNSIWKSGAGDEKAFLLGRTNLTASRWGTELLLRETRRAAAGKVSPLSLDLLQAAARSTDPALRNLTAAWKERLTSDADPLGEYGLALAGGNTAKGRQLFTTHAVQCVRCHRIKGFGGDAGPELTHIGRELKQAEIVTALIEPSQRIAPGFGTFEFDLKNGETIAGFVVQEDANTVTLLQMDGQRRSLPTTTISRRAAPVSSMPTMREVLTVAEARDVAAYLAALK